MIASCSTLGAFCDCAIMSGHSKWANIRVKKTAEDARRGKIFTRHARLIEIATRAGGPDPATNNTLRTAIENAREDNVPNANIERAIQKGSGELKGEQMSEVFYACYGPGSTAYLIEGLTDNKNRTLASVKSIVAKEGGRWAELGSVQWMFDRKGIVTGKKEAGAALPEDLELALIDAGAEDIDVRGDLLDVTAGATAWPRVRELLKGAGYEIVEAGLQYMPKQTVEVTDLETARKVRAFMEAIERDEDISEVSTNANISEEIAAQL